MGEITEDGYQTFRDFLCSETAIPDEWDYIELYDDTNSAVIRISITGGSRFQWTDADGDAILTVEGAVSGSDADIPQPSTLQQSAIWNADTGGVQCTEKEQFASATINQDGDSVTISHNVEVPQQP